MTRSNPARISRLIGSLFPKSAVAAELRTAGDPTLLLAPEMAALCRAVPQRIQEFAAGRLCARRALERLGFGTFPIVVSPNREPVWPDTVIGSITHTDRLCAAVVAPRESFFGIGLDAEVVGAVNPAIWRRVCAPAELVWLETLPSGARAAAVSLVFAAKEAFYKAQYGQTRQWLNFDDVTVTVPRWSADRGRFIAAPRPHLSVAARAAAPFVGRYRFHGDHVCAGIALANAA
ncbi:MAG: 4'-phosphopantetheinyl transferase superfamily protein [Gammaproteobacteria bacterium]|nr:4'-phosphopantetheinyl transferase superfamily protein [Gammaproteobacteria bacterium]MDE2347635.1 4'-phosphopantetheinyl transferase superfamily protein [Gammaproteobacteria bacterium]